MVQPHIKSLLNQKTKDNSKIGKKHEELFHKKLKKNVDQTQKTSSISVIKEFRLQ